MKKKCDLCENEHNESEMFHYEHLVDGVVIEVLVCENCLFELVGKDFCDSDYL